jgi:hypothetical protein
MFVGLHSWGAFVFWAGVCVVGLVVLGVWAPETKGVALERMDELFRGGGVVYGVEGEGWA